MPTSTQLRLLVSVCLCSVMLIGLFATRYSDHTQHFPGLFVSHESFLLPAARLSCKALSFLPNEIAAIGDCDVAQLQQNGRKSGFPANHGDKTALASIQQFVSTASLRSGYRYSFATYPPNTSPARLALQHRLMCLRSDRKWILFMTGPTKLNTSGVDDAARGSLGSPLVHGPSISAIGEAAIRRSISKPGAADAAAAALAGSMGIPPEYFVYNTPWHPRAASNAEWGHLLSGADWDCKASPADNPSCMQSFIAATAEHVQSNLVADALAKIHVQTRASDSVRGVSRRDTESPTADAVIWGRDDGGTLFGWDSAGICNQCLRRMTRSNLFLMWRVHWLLGQPLHAGASLLTASSLAAPKGLLTHWNCSLEAIPQETLQCALPVYAPHAGERGGGDASTCVGAACIELLHRTAFLLNPLWPHHHTHKVFHYLVPAAAVLHDLGQDPRRDVLAFALADPNEIDVSMVSRNPLLMKPGLLETPVGSKTRMSCFSRSVIGAAGVCANSGCPNSLLEPNVNKFASIVRRRLSLPDNQNAHKWPLKLYVIQRATSTRSFVNPQQLWDILRAFSGLDVRELRLEGATFKQQVELFSEASIVVATHGNALGNTLWMPRGSLVIEYMGSGFNTEFFAGLGRQHEMVWTQAECNSSALRQTLDRFQIETALQKLSSHPVTKHLVGPGTWAALTRVSWLTAHGRYSIPTAVALSANDTARHPNRIILDRESSCVFLSAEGDKSNPPGKNRHVYIPPAQFLNDFVSSMLQWAALQ